MTLPDYDLAEAAEEDLRNISLYTISKWGMKQAARYAAKLDTHFEAIGHGKAKSRSFLRHRPELRVSRVEHHFIFHLERKSRRPLILAVFHENMDLMSRLRSRLDA